MPPTLFPPACLPDIFTYCDCFWIIMIFEQGLSKASDSYNPWQGNCGAFTTSEESSSYCISAGQETRNTDTKQLFPSVCVCGFLKSQESEWAEGVTPGITSSFPGYGQRPEPRGPQGWVEGQGAETSGWHQDAARKTAFTGENKAPWNDWTTLNHMSVPHFEAFLFCYLN